MTEITLNKDEHIEYLRKDLGLIVSKEHTFGTDALLLADFASPKRYDICCDFGTGCGIIPMLLVQGRLRKRNIGSRNPGKGVQSAYALRQGKRFAGQTLCVQC